MTRRDDLEVGYMIVGALGGLTLAAFHSVVLGLLVLFGTLLIGSKHES